MVLFQELWDDRDAITTAYFLATRECESNRTPEISAIVTIQRVYRGFFARKYLAHLHKCATRIRAAWLGWRERCRFAVRQRAAELDRMRSFHGGAAVVIQRWFRGYHSRKFRQDYYARKRWVNQIAIKADQIHDELAQFEEEAFRTEQARLEAEASEQFEKATENLHHLLSTAVTPSVFKSVLGQDFEATAYEIPIEQHIKDSFKNHLVKTNTKLVTSRPVRARFASSMAAPIMEEPTTMVPAGSLADPYAPLPVPVVIPPQHTSQRGGARAAAGASMHTYAAAPHAVSGVKKSAIGGPGVGVKKKAGVDASGVGLIPKHARQKLIK